MAETDKEYKEYELSFLTDSEEDVREAVKILNTRGAMVVFEGPVKKLELSYPIRKRRLAYFGSLHFRCAASDIESIDSDFRLNNKILRHLIVTPPIAPKAAGSTPRRSSRAVVSSADGAESRDAMPAGQQAEEPSKRHVAFERGGSGQTVSNEELAEKLEEMLNLK